MQRKVNEYLNVGLRATGLFLAYFFLGYAGYFFLFRPTPVSLFWLPGGLTIAVLIRSRFRNWPVYLFAIFCSETVLSLLHDYPLRVSLFFGLADVMEPLMGAWVIRRYIQSFSVMRFRDVSTFFAAVVLTPVFGASIAAFAATEWGGQASYLEMFRTWWFAVSLGEIVVAPFILSWFRKGQHPYRGLRLIEEIFFILVVTVVAWLTFSVERPIHASFELHDFLLYLIFPLALWGVFRFEERGVSACILIVNVIAAYYTATGRGPFSLQETPPGERLIALQAYLTLINLSSLIILVTVADRRRSQQELKSIVENSATIVFLKDLKGRFLMINPRYEELIERKSEWVKGLTDFDLFPRIYAERFAANDRKVLAERKAIRFPETAPALNGTERFYLSVKFPLFDAAGEPYALCGFATDVTEMKSAEMRIRNAEERSRLMADISREFGEARLQLKTIYEIVAKEVAEFFEDGSIVRMFPYEGEDSKTVAFHHSDEAVLQVMRDTLPNTNAIADLEAKDELMRTGKALRVTVDPKELLKRLDPKVWPIVEKYPVHSWMVAPLWIAGKMIGTISAFRYRNVGPYTAEEEDCLQDIADRAALAIDNARLYQDSQKAIQLREDFISIASHELKTPLTPLKLQLSLLRRHLSREGAEIPQLDRLLKVVQNSDRDVDRLVRLVENLLDTSRITKGMISLSRTHCDLGEIVLSVLERYENNLKKAGCEVNTDLEKGVVGFWDPFRIEQVMVNLLTNAMKYGAGQPIEIKVDKSDADARVAIQDHGIGIQKKDHDRIFDRFERAMPITAYGGLGLGLFITRQILDAHHGKIRLESDIGQGSRFVVELPLEAKSKMI